MNPLTRHFLPSQVRGVYRFDDAFGKLTHENYAQYANNKLRFLPRSIEKLFSENLELTDRFNDAKKQLYLDGVLNDNTRIVKQRYSNLFTRFPYFSNALAQKYEGADNYLEIEFVKKILAKILNDTGMERVQPQKSIGKYYADFAIETETSKIVIEVDGFAKFKLRSNLDEFIERQNFITCEGWKVIRFTYGQVMNTPESSLKKLYDFLSSDPNFQGLLANTKAQVTLFNLVKKVLPAKANVTDIVNGFYMIQDWFVDQAISTKNVDNIFVLRDEFGYKLPIVAHAINSLYEFLDSIASLVDVNFNLPVVTIHGTSSPRECLINWHGSINISKKTAPKLAIRVDSSSVQNCSVSVPTPMRREDAIFYRNGLTVQDIQQNLSYVVREFFGYSRTKPFQDKVLQRLFNGEDTLGISATGSGKSFCFWLPSLLKPGLTIVIAPLRSLMRDQRLTLFNNGIASMEFINSDVKVPEQRRFLEEAKLGYIRLLYISPERLRIKKFVEELDQLQQFVPINLIAIDEAHCISEWGHDFRPSYLKLPIIRDTLIEHNPSLQIMALTATAGQQVERDMCAILKFDNTNVIREKIADRERFSYQIVTVESGTEKKARYRKLLLEDLPTSLKLKSLTTVLARENGRNEKDMGIVFCVYANPHGKHTVYDGTTHYLFETMEILESKSSFESRRGNYPKYNLDAFSNGRVRAFSSKPPTLCPKCHSYDFGTTSNATPFSTADYDVDIDDFDDVTPVTKKNDGLRKCLRCGHEFGLASAEVIKQKDWDEWVKSNQTDFKNSGFDVLVATKGFGMGIDKSSVRFVLHTSLSSGIESWYQEVGRAGRDDERAHIMLLVDPPNALCIKELESLETKRPNCSWIGGCKHGRNTICDYGKQHLFISRSYPGAESDAVSALSILDRLLSNQSTDKSTPIVLNSNMDYMSRHELALYRLMMLGVVEDYSVTYGWIPKFDVTLRLNELPSNSSALENVTRMMQTTLAEYLKHYEETSGNLTNLNRILGYRPLEDFQKKINAKFRILPKLTPLIDGYKYECFRTVYSYLLLLLDHTYKDVVTMRYDMLWNLLGVVNSQKMEPPQCLRVRILPYFEGDESVSDNYRCGCCNVCAPDLNYRNRVVPRPENKSDETSKIELEEMLQRNILDIERLDSLIEVFRDYSIFTYGRARAVLEGNPNNFAALYLTRAFSPHGELAANTLRLLKAANEKMIPLDQIRHLYETSASNLKSNLLLHLNEEQAACDNTDGWTFLVNEASKSQHRENESIGILHDCLEFFLIVQDAQTETRRYLNKAEKLEGIFNA